MRRAGAARVPLANHGCDPVGDEQSDFLVVVDDDRADLFQASRTVRLMKKPATG
jgi:hypothetical protein